MDSQDRLVAHRNVPVGSQNALVHTMYADTKVYIIAVTQASVYCSLASGIVQRSY